MDGVTIFDELKRKGTNVLYLFRKTLTCFHFLSRTMTSSPARKFILPHCALVHSPCRFYIAPSETRRCTISQWLSNFDLGLIKDRGTEAEAKLQCAAFDSNRSKAGSATSVPNSDRCYRSLTFKRRRIRELEIPLPSIFILHSRNLLKIFKIYIYSCTFFTKFYKIFIFIFYSHFIVNNITILFHSF